MRNFEADGIILAHHGSIDMALEGIIGARWDISRDFQLVAEINFGRLTISVPIFPAESLAEGHVGRLKPMGAESTATVALVAK